ncbi:hydrocarbon binding protein [Litorivicinus lipolyticus]|uniref:Hydrocarbon binding protein n=1 Tax=Litorivicinus lipolyticus TaxID=418701 RepID=A0A5Q2QDI4_9GAMM|nr:DUF5943 domain-containing protein [Litorivicinus lipolyticus]QGG80421.1 hydrocarbon binding protein [Litorivicinus lipolyticus]
MGHHAPDMPIQVDDDTGVWTTDALPMLYVPRHFFINNHVAVEEALGADVYAEALYKAGYKSAYFWCQKEAAEHGLAGDAVFLHYMKRLSQRGWGIFTTQSLDVAAGTCRVRLDHSSFYLQLGKVDRKVEYMFTGWFAGAMDQVAEAQGVAVRTQAHQVQSQAETGCEFGLFETTPI